MGTIIYNIVADADSVLILRHPSACFAAWDRDQDHESGVTESATNQEQELEDIPVVPELSDEAVETDAVATEEPSAAEEISPTGDLRGQKSQRQNRIRTGPPQSKHWRMVGKMFL